MRTEKSRSRCRLTPLQELMRQIRHFTIREQSANRTSVGPIAGIPERYPHGLILFPSHALAHVCVALQLSFGGLFRMSAICSNPRFLSTKQDLKVQWKLARNIG